MLLAVAALVFLAAERVVEIFTVDACLDKGGSYDYVTGACDLNQKHPPVPYIKRHPETGVAASLAVVAALLSVLLMTRAGGLTRKSST